MVQYGTYFTGLKEKQRVAFGECTYLCGGCNLSGSMFL